MAEGLISLKSGGNLVGSGVRTVIQVVYTIYTFTFHMFTFHSSVQREQLRLGR